MLGKIIKNLRKTNNLTQQEMADMLSIKRPTYTNYENGKIQPPVDKLELIAEHFHVSIDYLMGRTDDPTPYRDVDSDLNGSPDEELKQLLSDPQMRVAFKDYSSWSDEDKREMIKIIKLKNYQRETKEWK